MSNFDEAREQSMSLFGQTESAPAEESAEVLPTEEPTDVVEEPAPEQTGEIAEEPAENVEALEGTQPGSIPEADTGVNQLVAENELLRSQLQSANATIQQMSQQREQEVVEDATTPAPPQFESVDMSGLAFGEEETQRRVQSNLAENIAKYVMQMVDGRMKEMKPFVDEARRGQAEREKRTAIENLSNDEITRGIGDVVDRLDVIISANPQMFPDSMSAEDKYTAAYALMLGAQTLKNPPKPPAEPTTEELMNIYRNNNDFRDAIERERIEAVKKNQQVPVFSASNGVGNAAPTINEKPKTMADAKEATFNLFRS